MARHLAAHGDGRPSVAAGAGNFVEHPKEGWRQCVVAAGNAIIDLVGGENELKQSVGSDRKKIDLLVQFIQLPKHRGNFDHGAENLCR